MSIPMIENWCDQCVNGVTYNVDPLVMASLVADSVMGMGPFGELSVLHPSFHGPAPPCPRSMSTRTFYICTGSVRWRIVS